MYNKKIICKGLRLSWSKELPEQAVCKMLMWIFKQFLFLLLLQLAIDYGIKFLETSAKSSTNVEEVGEICLMLI